MSEKLLPCPFCGEEDEIFTWTNNDKIVECGLCAANANIDYWNDRVETPKEKIMREVLENIANPKILDHYILAHDVAEKALKNCARS